ncbi:cytochrome c oxidase subunit II transmembrane domain-containing protein, partial [Sphingomonas sp.]|uniref:cytochrome c oxidase subunit II transmembrane domain-containing protein n=1 Tax=Sphingomonas sp. TaxID=28214 RepID=UPI0035C858A1
MNRLKTMILAGGLALAGLGLGTGGGVGGAHAQTPVSAPEIKTTPPGVPTALEPANAVDPAAPNLNAATPARLADEAPGAIDLSQDGGPAMVINPKIGQPTDGLMRIQPQVTKNGMRANWFHDKILFPLITVVSIFVLLLLVVVIVRFRAARNPIPSKTSHNTFIEVVWTLAPVLILLAIAVPSIGLLQAQFKPAPAGAVTLKAIGNQWYWSY